MSNLLALVNFFRTSPRRKKLLHQEDERCLTFPKHFEVRFAHLIRAVLHNLKAATKVWEKMVSGEIAPDKKNVPWHQEDERCLTFPKHFEVRFAHLIRAVLHNLKAATKV